MTSVTHEALIERDDRDLSGTSLRVPRVNRSHVSLVVVLLFALIPILYVPVQTGNRFLSDDMSMYWAARQFGETGKLYIEDDLTRNDEENLIHPRGFVTHNGRAVPYNFLGMPVIYGAAYAVVGSGAEYLGAVLAVAGLAAIWGILGIVQGAARRWTFPLVILLAYPMLYYFGRPYMNVVPALAFFLIGLFLLLRHYQQPSWQRAALAAAAFSVGVFCRYPDALLVAPLVSIVLWQRYGSLRDRRLWKDLGIFAAVSAVVFGIPLLVFNQLTYGSPLTYGYGLFNDAYYPDRGGIDEGGLAGSLNTLGVWVLPGGVDFSIFASSAEKYLFKLTPLIPVLAALGCFALLQTRGLPKRFVVANAALLAYALLYAGSGAVWGTQFDYPTLGHTMVRYWLIAYLGLAFAASFLLLRTKDAVLRLAIVGVAFTLAAMGLFSGEDSLPRVKESIDKGQVWVQTNITPYTPEDAVIYTGRTDKYVMGTRRVAAWYNAADETFFNPVTVAASMNRVVDLGLSAFVVKEPETDVPALRNALSTYGLTLVRAEKSALYEVVSVDDATGSRLR